MFNFIFKTFPHVRSSARSSLTVFKLYRTKAGDESLGLAKKRASFVASYLVDRCGFAPEKALSASNYMKFESPDKPESVLSFLKTHGFTESQISKLIRKCPPVLLCNPQNTLLPKIEHFKSVGFTKDDYTTVLCECPSIFKRSLKNQLFPALAFLKKFFDCPEKIIVCLKRTPWCFSESCQATVEANIHLLREMTVPESSILYCFQNQPRLFIKDKEKFTMILEKIKGMGFDSSKRTFMVAVHVFCSMSKLTWEKKVHAYMKWGLSEDQVSEAFGKNPWIMACSEEKILLAMEFFVNKMGLKPSDVLSNPVIIMLSLEKRIIPRSLVYQTLASKGLFKKELKLFVRMLKAPEEKFLMEYVKRYENEVPDLMKLYHMSGLMAVPN
ncbi:unnamed protein product [Cuscuta epithymum]|uniref:Uncharacterized protein n=3 Tax=Cuscuta epithymum TaxID=186058 RepID=A0AAV0F2U2_9ASTE|nr:unnamed protein product [Cuscuta epithymum]